MLNKNRFNRMMLPEKVMDEKRMPFVFSDLCPGQSSKCNNSKLSDLCPGLKWTKGNNSKIRLGRVMVLLQGTSTQ
jgi:hypothetical protein